MEYLSITAIFRLETPWLAEWVRYHENRGVERFYLFNNDHDHGHARRELADSIASGRVVMTDFPGDSRQMQSYDAGLLLATGRTRWMAFVDIDEFIVPAIETDLRVVMSRFESHPAVAVNWLSFGTSHRKLRPASAINGFVMRRKQVNRMVKSIVQVDQVEPPAFNPHYFNYRTGFAVDTSFRRVDGPFNPNGPIDVLRINHYMTRSEEDLAIKLSKPRGDTGQLRTIKEYNLRDTNEIVDDLACIRFGGELS